jgi:hypothetical protein
MSIGYACEKLWEAVHDLALGPGRVKDRLDSAAKYVAMAAGARHDFADFRTEYEAVWARLTAVHARGDEGAVRATLAQMSEDEACEIASQILDLAYKAKNAMEQELERR